MVHAVNNTVYSIQTYYVTSHKSPYPLLIEISQWIFVEDCSNFTIGTLARNIFCTKYMEGMKISTMLPITFNSCRAFCRGSSSSFRVKNFNGECS